jgi:predicted phage terminase large subunit-like protein
VQPQPTPEDYAKELERRRRRDAFLRAGPGGIAEHLSAGAWKQAAHLALLNEALIGVAEGRITRLLITEPPRHGKSELTSHWFPVWYLSLFPRRDVLLASYEADFAMRWGRKVRNTIQAHEEQLPAVRIADDSSAASRWATSAGGSMETCGVGGAMTGKGAHLLLVDDPVKNAEEADSQVIRDRNWNWWTSTAYTRLEPTGAAVVIQTRWHEDDLAGRLLADAKAGGEPWHVINLPAIAEKDDALGRPEGEPLWPERFDRAALARIRKAVGERVWNALYQQRPAPDTGAVFLRPWFRYWRHAWQPAPTDPEMAKRTVVLPRRFQEVFQSWDLAFKDSEGSDLVAGAKVGCNGANRYLLDLDWERKSFTQSLAAMVKLAKVEPAGLATLVEDAANGPAAISSLRGTLPGIIAVKPLGSKRARGASVTPIFEAGQFFIPLYATWRQALEEELATFPFGAHDDAVDSITQALTYAAGRDYPEVPDEAPAEGSRAWEKDMERQIVERDSADQEDLDRW